MGAKGWLEARMIETYYTVTILNPVHKQPAKKRAKAQFPLTVSYTAIFITFTSSCARCEFRSRVLCGIVFRLCQSEI